MTALGVSDQTRRCPDDVGSRRDPRILEAVITGFSLTIGAAGVMDKLSAGVAHELNNPASAARRSAGQLQVRPANGDDSAIDAGATFVFIGAGPRTDWLDGLVLRDEAVFVRTGSDISGLGVFAVGDVRSDSVKRVASAVGEGSIAVQLVHAYLGA